MAQKIQELKNPFQNIAHLLRLHLKDLKIVNKIDHNSKNIKLEI